MTLISRFLDLCDQSHIYGRGNLGIEKCRWIAIGIFLKANRLFLMCNRILILLVFGIPMIAKADIYVSQSGDMIAKWSTHPHDATYSKTSIVDALPVNEVRPIGSNDAQTSPKRFNSNQSSLHGLIVEVSAKYAVPFELVEALIAVESGFNTNAVSRKGARGLMQLMPATARRYGMKNENELHVPALNLDMGVRHLKDLLRLHQGQLALTIASYNAGQHAIVKYGNRIPRYQETMLYVPAVLAEMERNRSLN